MSELVFINNDRVVTDSLMVAEAFGKRHSDVLRSVEHLGCSKEFNERNFALDDYTDRKGERRPKYLITQDGFTLLVMGYTGKTAMEFKEKYIDEFNRMKKELNKHTASYMIDDPIKRAQMWIEEQKQRLMLEQQVKEYEPKVTYYDLILQSKDVINISQISKDYGLSGAKLNKILKQEGVQYKMNGQWLLYSKHQDKGYTKSHTTEYTKSNGDVGTKLHTKWTQKGRLFIHNILSKQGIEPLMDRDIDRKEA
jgi:Rha family phage regulatory protein